MIATRDAPIGRVPINMLGTHNKEDMDIGEGRCNDVSFGFNIHSTDPDRPKNDKASILVESAQVVKDLRAELMRLKAEHASLLDESRELTVEKNELKEEKATLKSDTDQLKDQFQQHFRTVSPWMVMDPAVMMSAASFPYPLPVPQASPVPSSNCQPSFTPSQVQRPLVAPSPYVPLATIGAFPLHPGLHTYAAFGNRHGDGSGPYLQFPNFAPPLNGHSHVERPYAQYPSQLHPLPPYVAQIQPHQESHAPVSSSGSGTEICRPYASNALSVPVQTHVHSSPVSLPNVQTEEGGKPAVSTIDAAAVEHRDSSAAAVNCSSEVSPNDMNQEVLLLPSSSATKVCYGSNAQKNQNINSQCQDADVKRESKKTVEEGSTDRVSEVASQQAISDTGEDIVNQHSSPSTIHVHQVWIIWKINRTNKRSANIHLTVNHGTPHGTVPQIWRTVTAPQIWECALARTAPQIIVHSIHGTPSM
eukprot:Gb_07948 [translate_table: standard]